MPKINNYQSRVENISNSGMRQAREEDFGDYRGLSQFASGVGAAVDTVQKSQDTYEVSDLTANLSDAHVRITARGQELSRTWDPSQGSMADKMSEIVEQELDGISEKASTPTARNFYTRQTAELKRHFLESSIYQQAQIVGSKAKDNYIKTLNNFTGALTQDPSSYDSMKELYSQSVSELVKTGGLSTEEANQLNANGQKALAKSAIEGWIDKDVTFAEQQIKSGRWDEQLGGELKTQMLGEVQAKKRADQVELERIKKRDEEVLKQNQMVTQNNFLAKLASNELTTKEILKSNLDPFGSGSKEQFMKLVEANAKDAAGGKTDPATFRNLFSRINLPDGDPKKIIDENDLNQYVIDKRLSYDDLNKLRSEMQGKKTAAGKEESELTNRLFKIAESKLSKTNWLGMKDPDGDKNLLAWTNQFYADREQAKKEGIPFRELYNPNSKHFLGNSINNYAKTPEQIIQESMGQTTQGQPAALPPEKLRKPGESIQEWKARTQGK